MLSDMKIKDEKDNICVKKCIYCWNKSQCTILGDQWLGFIYTLSPLFNLSLFPHNYKVFPEVTKNSLVRTWEFCLWESSVHVTSILWDILVQALSLISSYKIPLGLGTLIFPSMPSWSCMILLLTPTHAWQYGTWLFTPPWALFSRPEFTSLLTWNL